PPALKLPSPPFPLLLNSNRCRRRFAPPLRAASSSSSSSLFPLGANLGRRFGGTDVENNGNVGFLGRLRSGLFLLRDVFPGGSWWKLEQEEEMKANAEEQDRGKKGLSVITALRRMWELVAKDRLVIFLAFASLLFAAVRWMSFCLVIFFTGDRCTDIFVYLILASYVVYIADMYCPVNDCALLWPVQLFLSS
ncbi:hypothetical protein B296_00010002, partial [Ensete ventricosum]